MCLKVTYKLTISKCIYLILFRLQWLVFTFSSLIAKCVVWETSSNIAYPINSDIYAPEVSFIGVERNLQVRNLPGYHQKHYMLVLGTGKFITFAYFYIQLVFVLYSLFSDSRYDSFRSCVRSTSCCDDGVAI